MNDQKAKNIIKFFSITSWIIPPLIILCLFIFLWSQDTDFFPHNYIVDITSFSTCYEAQEEGHDRFILSKRILIGSETIYACGYIVNETPHKAIIGDICWFELNSKGALSCSYIRYELEQGNFYSDFDSSDLPPGKYRVEIGRGRETLSRSVFTIVPRQKDRTKIRR